MPLSEAARPLTAFQTPMGLFQFTKMPFGLVIGPATFCRLMREFFLQYIKCWQFHWWYLIFTYNFDQHICVFSDALERLHSANPTARPTRCSLAYQKLECLGNIVGDDKIHPHPDKVSAIQKTNHHTTKKQLRSFLGSVNFYRKCTPKFAHIALPLTDLTRKFSANKLQWTTSHEIAI